MVEVIMPAGMALSTLNAVVAQLEAADGPLVAMRIDKRSTILVHDDSQPRPTVFAVIHAPGATPPGGAAHVCAGRILVGGEEGHYTAFRPKG